MEQINFFLYSFFFFFSDQAKTVWRDDFPSKLPYTIPPNCKFVIIQKRHFIPGKLRDVGPNSACSLTQKGEEGGEAEGGGEGKKKKKKKKKKEEEEEKEKKKKKKKKKKKQKKKGEEMPHFPGKIATPMVMEEAASVNSAYVWRN